MNKIKAVGMLIACVTTGWIGWSTYSYMFDRSVPHVQIDGLVSAGYYCGDVQCSVTTDKKGELSVWLDGQPLLSKFKVSGAGQAHPFSIPSKTIANGEHSARIEFVDSTYNKNSVELDRIFYVDNMPLQAAFVRPESDAKVFQGRTLHLQFQVNKPIASAKVKALSHEYECFPESENSSIYECFMPIPCEEKPNEYLLTVEVMDNVGNTLNLENKFQVVMYPFKKQTISIDKKKVEEEKAIGKSIRQREEDFARLAAQSPKEKMWRGAFCTPIDVQRVTTEFGVVRTTQEKGRYMHKALDVINMPKSVVWTPQAGVVVLKDRYEDAGNVVAVDHGWGVISYFYHLDDFAEIEVGQKLAQGNPIGTLGKTGYARGYHLHWEMHVNNVAIDPMQWTKSTF